MIANLVLPSSWAPSVMRAAITYSPSLVSWSPATMPITRPSFPVLRVNGAVVLSGRVSTKSTGTSLAAVPSSFWIGLVTNGRFWANAPPEM